MRFTMNLIASCARFIKARGLFCLYFSLFTTLATGQTVTPTASVLSPSQVSQGLQPFSSAAPGAPPAPWRLVGLPKDKAPLAQLDIVALDGAPVLRLRTDQSYGTLSHALPPDTAAGGLRWRWRLDVPMPAANLRRKDRDDAPLKVCAMFDLPLSAIPFVERSLLRLARSVSGEYLPGATLCYVWDHTLPAGTELANAYTRRVRFVVLDSGSQRLGQWVAHQQDLHADFLRLFGAESDTVPPLLAIVVGADSDNTGSTSLGYLGDLSLMKQ